MSRCYLQLTLADRRRLHQLVERKVPVNEMARQLGRHRSTIYREIRRNTFHDRELPEYSGYFSTVANDIAKDRRQRLRKLRRHPQLRDLIVDRLQASWSPEQIAGRLWADGLSLVRICAETIYRFVYSKEDYGLGLYRYLPEARRKRRPRGSRKPRDRVFPEVCKISQRPDFIDDRSQFGHWEGDLLIFRRDLGPANVTSLVERKSRYTVMVKNQSRHSQPIMDKIIKAFSPLPAFARQSFTFDRGTEFAGFRALEDGIGARSWFCDPSAPWQKGAVENTNKRIRRFMPGETDLTAVSQQDLIQLARQLNDQPRKCLGYRTPAEVLPHAFARRGMIPYPQKRHDALGVDSPRYLVMRQLGQLEMRDNPASSLALPAPQRWTQPCASSSPYSPLDCLSCNRIGGLALP